MPTRSRRIALVSDCYPPGVGGIEVQVHDLALQLTAAGHEVVVLTTTPGEDSVDGVAVERIPLQKPLPAAVVPSVLEDLAARLEASGADVAHFHGGVISPLAFAGAAASQMAGRPTVVTVHCLWSYATPLFRLAERRWGWSRWPMVLSAVSDVAAAPIRRLVGPRREVLVLPNGIDVASWRVQPAEPDPETFTVVAVMRLAPRKRPLHLLRMLERLDGEMRGRRMRAVIVGDGPMAGAMERYVQSRGLGDRITLTGRLSRREITGIYAAADAFVAPANLESFGIAALEARCAGLPVVAKAHTGVREFVEHGREGLLATDDADMVRQLARLATDDELREQIAAHNRAVAPPMDWPKVAQANLAAYEAASSLVAS